MLGSNEWREAVKINKRIFSVLRCEDEKIIIALNYFKQKIAFYWCRPCNNNWCTACNIPFTELGKSRNNCIPPHTESKQQCDENVSLNAKILKQASLIIRDTSPRILTCQE